MPVRTVGKDELNRMKKRGGVKVKRKLGTGKKKPEPEIKEEALALSGANSTKLPSAPALTPAPVPHAAMSASVAASDEQMSMLVENNTKAIQNFSKKLESLKPAEKSIWQKADFIRHKVKRLESKLIDYVDSIPMRNK
jgi:hypothetical protein